MRKDITVVAESRESRGKNEARRLRVRGLSPAVVYGAGKDPVAVSVSPKEISKILHSTTGANTIFNLNIANSETIPVMVVDSTVDPLKGKLLHIDLKRIDLTKRIHVKVPVHTHGEAKGVKIYGGLLEAVTREVEIECLPDDIPDGFNIDVTELMVGQSVRASDIPLTQSMKLVSAPEQVITHVVSLKADTDATADAAAGGAEPEVIKKGKKEEEGKAAAGGKAAPAAKAGGDAKAKKK